MIRTDHVLIFFSSFPHMAWTRAVLRVNLSVEEHASKVYTRAMFEQFGHNLYQAGAYRVEEVEKGNLYLAKHTKPHKREKWSMVVFEVKLWMMVNCSSVSAVCSSIHG
jgi:hypothetical protein